jgi:hypothetical protein
LDNVSLTATPATSANSTETSGIRVDGTDTLTQPITGLSTTNGVIKFKFTPRMNFANVPLWGAGINSIMYMLNGGDYLILYKSKQLGF